MTYEEVLELDKKLKDFPLHPDVTGDKSGKKGVRQLNMRGSLHPMASLFWKELGTFDSCFPFCGWIITPHLQQCRSSIEVTSLE